MYQKKNNLNILLYLNFLLIIIFLASSMKAIYYMYLVLIPIILFKKNFLENFLLRITFLIIFSIGLLGNITTNYLSTGCFLYPAEKLVLVITNGQFPKDVKKMKVHYEWWASWRWTQI